MAQKRDQDYFEIFVQMNERARTIAAETREIFLHFDTEKLSKKMWDVHAHEKKADEIRYSTHQQIARDFITPIERGDILELMEQLDSIVDAVEDVIIKVYIFDVKEILPAAIEFIDIIVSFCEGLDDVLHEFKNYKKSKTIHQKVVELNRLEEAGDRLYMKAVRDLYQKNDDPKEVMAWTEIYSQMEVCCDQCAAAADQVAEAVMKNT